jgi:hypothetical protein
MEKMIVFYGNANGSLFPKELSVFQVDLWHRTSYEWGFPMVYELEKIPEGKKEDMKFVSIEYKSEMWERLVNGDTSWEIGD